MFTPLNEMKREATLLFLPRSSPCFPRSCLCFPRSCPRFPQILLFSPDPGHIFPGSFPCLPIICQNEYLNLPHIENFTKENINPQRMYLGKIWVKRGRVGILQSGLGCKTYVGKIWVAHGLSGAQIARLNPDGPHVGPISSASWVVI